MVRGEFEVFRPDLPSLTDEFLGCLSIRVFSRHAQFVIEKSVQEPVHRDRHTILREH
jgi:hypothetical protein